MDPFGLSQHEWSNSYTDLSSHSARAHDPVVEASSISLERWIAPSSPAFGPDFTVADALPDIVLLTVDQVRFHAHLRRLLHASANSFGGLLAKIPDDRTVAVPERASVLSIALRVLYGLPCLHMHPALDDVDLATEALVTYGIDVRRLAAPSLPLYQLILSFAPSHPIEAYCVAGRYDLQDVAIAASSSLLTYDLSTLPDALVARMGPTYCKRLVDLEKLRQSALGELLDVPVAAHPPSPACDNSRSQLDKVWKTAIAAAVWDGSFENIAQTVFETYEEVRTTSLCTECKSALEERIENAAREWAAVKAQG
ncbi:hypothetical protein OH76DRAFT_335152 [Lentinus brumalis]|uniref:BTB domain-containing protein n=1 Tax=Lentinus brumalis TaxID=2498619 RepID=A0A371CJV2_9APHY|nr:hypothetical protein OH76DRAFT_335152 [Polyporus brumalis]